MWIGVVTLFPQMFAAVRDHGIAGRACEAGLLQLAFWNPRDYAADKRGTVDDKPYGGGPGMLMMAEPLGAAIKAAQAAGRQAKGGKCPVVCLGPQGARLEQAGLERLAAAPALALVAGRYAGIDERVMEALVDEEVSIGDYVLSGGELPAMALIEGMARLLPGALGDAESLTGESFADGLLAAPQYTRPEEALGLRAPAALLSGDHAAIARWRRMQSLGRTRDRRPDLFERLSLSAEDQQLLAEYDSIRKENQDEQEQNH